MGWVHRAVTAGAVTALCVGVLAGTPAMASGSSTAPAASGRPTASAPAHPGSDYLGSTIGAHTTVTPKAAARAATASGSGVTTPGMDVSHYQGTVDWGAAASQGAKFAYMKATESTTYVDPQFTANFAGSANAGLLRGAYHFGLPDTSSGAAQALYFLSHGGGWVADGKTLPPVLDIEYNPYSTQDWPGWCYNLTPAQVSAWISDFVTTVHDRTNRWPVIYTTNGWWTNCTGSNPNFANDPLWIAGTNPTIPASWTDFTFNQTASSGTFAGDQDVFNGSPADLQALATGTVADKIAQHYAEIGGAASDLGNPSGAEYPAAGGWAQNYEHGIIGYFPATGAYAVHGAIWQHYQELGGPGGVLGLPTTDETGTPDGVGRYNHFTGTQGASIYWTPSIGAKAIYGMIRQKWAALGWETGLGYPTTDETGTPDGIGRYNHFNGAQGASIYWTASTGAQSIHGLIRQKWADLGWEWSGLHYPTSDEFAVPGGRRNNFQGGTITFVTANSTTQVAYY